MSIDQSTGEAARNPRDGKPFYCVKCRCGLDEYLACELPDCELESEASAEMRAAFAKAPAGPVTRQP